MRFLDAADMLLTVQSDMDLYNEITGEYVFLYNPYGSIAVYTLDKETVKKIVKQSDADHQYWGAYLGQGGQIYDDPEYDGFNPNLESNLDYCKGAFEKEGWVYCEGYNVPEEVR